MNLRAFVFVCSLLFAMPALAEICRYVDRDGNLHYTNAEPEKGWKKLDCGVTGTHTAPTAAPAVMDSKKPLANSLAKVRIGMTVEQLDAIDRRLIDVAKRRELVTVAGTTVTRSYPDGQYIIMRDGRVIVIHR